ncbi:pyridoxal phosphate-dependent aminotransferase [Geothermobacter hydrogeniphilus]|uniref:Aminotransferase n=1 Tax=Geothermobacter hydrogeniphilus TaxID=1969733 RepID=A0A1X0YAH5_9BACT|nr:pyridoxal phosphate-dependent aminotransferase [Geothermobacter hydrogeniphilus]ORJ62116.1 aspartate aminotransferase [Geothermobacter hydrogeniphilus]
MNRHRRIPLSKRSRQVTPFLAMEVMERARELQAAGREVIYLCLGEPDFATPQPVVEAVVEAVRGGDTGYTHSLGRLDLREEIAAHYQQRYGVDVDPEQVLVSAGTSPLMLLLFAALLDPGDEVILPDPSYACYPNFITFFEGLPRYLKTRPEDAFQPRPEVVRAAITDRTRALLINSPSNPAGSVMPPAWLEQLAELPVPVVSDEIYHGLTYQGEERSILEYSSEAFVLGGFSKTYAMTGWRLGYLIAPRSCVRTLQSLHQNFLISANNFVQAAGIAALRHCGDDVERMRAAYDARRRHLLGRLPELGLGVERDPVAAFYVLADARHISTDSKALALELLEQTGVALTPGVDFGAAAEGFLRFSYANSIANIDRAIELLKEYFGRRGWLP